MDNTASSQEGRDWLSDLSRGLYAAQGLVEACEASYHFWHRVDRLALAGVVKKLHVALRVALATPVWQSIELAEPDEPAIPCRAPSDVCSVFFLGADELSKRGQSARALDELNDALLQAVRDELQDILILQCTYPDPEVNPEFRLPGRAMFVLRRYWEFLHSILAATGDGSVGWTPHPLTRIIVNLQERIEVCLSIIDDPQLAEAFAQVGQVIEGMFGDFHDFDIDWEYGGAAAAASFFVALERAVIRLGSAKFDLTTAERTFIESVDSSLTWYKESVDREFAKMLPPQPRTARDSRPVTLADYISSVELALRRVLAAAYQKRYGDAWPQAMRQTMEIDELQDTEARLAKEGKADTDIVHMLNPGPLRQLITADWSITGRYFPQATRKSINVLLDQWLAARTKVAHNRPTHLWPEIERKRAEVACHDLLAAIAEEQRRLAGE